MSKSDLKARPIFHHKRESIQAHLTIVFTALAIAPLARGTTGWRTKKLVTTLRRYHTVQIQAATTPSPPPPRPRRAPEHYSRSGIMLGMELLLALGLRVFAHLPVFLRRVLVWVGSPKYIVGSVVVIEVEDRFCLLRQPHGIHLNLPGGLKRARETPRACIDRELQEELSLHLSLPAHPASVLIDEAARRIDFVYAAQLDARPSILPSSAEVLEVCWLDLKDPRIAGAARRILQEMKSGPE